MNGKQAKRIRRRVYAVTVGTPWRVYQRTNQRGTIALHPGCGRSLQKKVKRVFLRRPDHA